MKNVMLIVACLVSLSTSSLAAAQSAARPKTPDEAVKDVEKAQSIKQKAEEAQANARPARPLTNVQIELTLTDQSSAGPVEKKTVSMIVASSSLGKVRSAGTIRPQADAPYPVMLNVDARPYLNADGSVTLELTVEYYPLKDAGQEKEGVKQRPSGINQSQTVVLQNGKPLAISQAADPINDRKVIVEVKATVIK
jgi:hypothetical protein